MLDLITVAQELLKRRSITPDDQNCQQYIKTLLSKFNFTHIDCSSNATTNSIYTLNLNANEKHNNGAHLVFIGHTDVVEPGDLNAWKFNPFAATIDNNILYARGAADMKAAIAAFIIAIEQWVTNKATDKHNLGRISILLTSDEEGAALDGIKYVIANRMQIAPWLNQIDHCLVGEASAIKTVGDRIKTGRRGSIHATITIETEQGHIAFPSRYENSIHKMQQILNQLINYEWDKGNQFFSPTKCQVYRVRGGLEHAENIIPPKCQAWINWRYNDEIDFEYIKNITQSILQQNNITGSIEWRHSGKPDVTKKGRLLDISIQACIDVTQQQPLLCTEGGTSDARFITELCDDIVELGAVDKTIHEVNENISIPDLHKLAQIYQYILDKI